MTLTDHAVAVAGGELAVAVLGEQDPAAPTILAVHGITASSRSFLGLERALSGVRIVAPDLRGRGRSNTLPPPYGLRRHAEDLARVLDAFGLERAVVAGHSMGAFCAVLLGAAEPDRVAGLVLVDGGLPLPAPEGGLTEEALQALLGPAADRLTREFPDREGYRAFWSAHPAFAADWNADVEAYVDYDLQGREPHLRPAGVPEAVGADQRELYGPDWYLDALRALRMPVTALRAPRGLLDDAPLYPAGRMDSFAALVPQLEVVEVDDVNHYTIAMAPRGARRVAEAITRQMQEASR
ncbi:MAG: alpha/beta fold hydrolase [Actinomycetales bacterium]|nr:alpha/beta fold hydrolase [Actinomycetales bacterium]